MSEPDTNQASENYLWEELADKLEWYYRYRKRGQDDDMDRAFDGILALIRTEKLKLLSEVRERVVGEDLPLNTTPDTGQRIYNKVKANERTALTKLEAEL